MNWFNEVPIKQTFNVFYRPNGEKGRRKTNNPDRLYSSAPLHRHFNIQIIYFHCIVVVVVVILRCVSQ